MTKHPLEDIDNDTAFNIALAVYDILFYDFDEDGDFWNPDKPWDSDTLQDIGNYFDILKLRPTTKIRA